MSTPGGMADYRGVDVSDRSEFPDDDLDRAMEGIRRKAKAWEDTELARMEATLSQTTPPAFYKDVPPPGFCHPHHERAKRFIVDWLDGKSSIGGYDLRLPVVERMKFELYEPLAPVVIPEPKVIRLRKEKAYAIAPYVGRPFGYWWYTAVDDMGRSVGGEDTNFVYTDHRYDEWAFIPYATGAHKADESGPEWREGRCSRCGQSVRHDIHRTGSELL